MLFAFTARSLCQGLRIRFDGSHIQTEKCPVTELEEMPVQRQIFLQAESYRKKQGAALAIHAQNHGVVAQGSIMAQCLILSPEGARALRGPTEERATILFDTSDLLSDRVCFPWQRRLRVRQGHTIASIVDTMLDYAVSDRAKLQNIDVRILYGAVCLSLMLDDGSRHQRCSRSSSLLSVLESIYGCHMEKERVLLTALERNEVIESRALFDELYSITSNTMSLYLTQTNNEPRKLCDLCPACPSPQPLLWYGVVHTQCPVGHTYDRCALSFLPLIGAQGSKACLDCGRDFLNERTYAEMQHETPMEGIAEGALSPSIDNQPHSDLANGEASSLACYLFEKFDVCPYCGGFFSN